MSKLWSLRSILAAMLPIVILALAGWELHRQQAAMDWAALAAAFARIGTPALVLSVLATAGSFASLTLIEAWAVRTQARMPVPVATAMAGGAAAHALCHVLGWHAVLGAAVRRRAYAGHGAGAAQLAGILVTVGAAVLAGALVMFAIAAASRHAQSGGWWLAASVVLLAIWGSRKTSAAPARVGWRGLGVRLRRTAAILPVAALEALAALTALWVLVPPGAFPGWSTFVLTCLLAQAAGVASHVPGGIGVFEAAMLASAPAESRAGLLAAILAYRAVYGLLPFVVIGLPWVAWSWLHPPRPQAAQLETG